MVKARTIIILICSLLVFAVSLKIGHWLSLKKPLWNDEIYTQSHSIDSKSYLDIIQIKFVEGNSSPLFYLIQKKISDVFDFSFPVVWEGYEWEIADSHAQVIMRLSSVLFMSLAISLIFYFFSRYYSFLMGAFSMLMMLSTETLWVYWAECRPYSLWICQTVIQILLLHRILKEDESKKKYWIGLFILHVVMAFTLILSVAQILTAGVVLYLYGNRAMVKRIVWVILPVLICLGYYFFSPTKIYPYWLIEPSQLIFLSFSQERMIVMFAYIVFLLVIGYLNRTGVVNWKQEGFTRINKVFLVYSAMMLMAGLTLLLIFKLRSDPAQQTIFASNRYFVFLGPVGVVMTTLIFHDLLQKFKGNLWMCVNWYIVFWSLVILQALKAYHTVITSGVYS